MIFYTNQFLVALGFTCIVEALLLLVISKLFKLAHDGITSGKVLATGVFASFATLPYVWYVIPAIFYGSHQTSIVVAEVFIMIVEAVFYYFALRFNARTAFATSAFLNLVSWSLFVFLQKM
jgi:hypothetical protein